MKAYSDTGPWTMIPLWVIQNVNPTAVVVYAQLSSHVNNEGDSCWPSHKSLADALNLSVSTVKRSIDALIELGAVVKKNRFKGDGSPTSNEYWIIHACPDHLRTEVSSDMNPPPSTSEPTSVHERTEVSSDVSYKLEPINYNHITKTKELDLLETSSSVKELTYEPIVHIPPPKPKPGEWEALLKDLLEACAMDPDEVTQMYWPAVGKAAKAIWDVGGRAGDCVARAHAYRINLKKASCTPTALAKWLAKSTPASIQADQINDYEKALRDEKDRQMFARLDRKAIS